MNNDIVEFLNSRNKVELSAQVVELASLKSVKSIGSIGAKEFDNGNIALSKLKGMFTDVKTNFRQAGIKFNEAIKEAEEINSQLKVLGVEAPSELTTLITWLKSNEKEAKEKIQSLQTSEKGL
jgi:hypothetical protein